MNRCTTTHGLYRCRKTAGHTGDCESPDLSGIAVRTGRQLDELGAVFKVEREGTSDEIYRAKIWARATA